MRFNPNTLENFWMQGRWDGYTYSDPVRSVKVLRLFLNNESGYSWHVFIVETMYNLSNTKLLLLDCELALQLTSCFDS